MRKLFILTACIMIITGCNGLIKPEKGKNTTPSVGTIDVTEIKIDSHVFSQNVNLTLLAGTTLTVSKNLAAITVKASNVSKTAGIKINGQTLVPFTNGEAKQTVGISKLTDVKLEIFDTAKQTLVYTFKLKMQEVEKIELLSSDSHTLERDEYGNYTVKLLTGSEYQIRTKVLPENAQNRQLSFILYDKWKDFITVSDEGLLTVLKKTVGYNLPYLSIESTNGISINLFVDIDNQIETIIREWKLIGAGVDQTNENNHITLSQGDSSQAILKIVKRNPHISYQYEADSNHIQIVKTALDSVTDQYQITIQQNQTVWEKNSSIHFYIKEYNAIKRVWEDKTLKKIFIKQGANFNFEKKMEWVHGVQEPSLAELSKRKPFEYAEWYESEATKWFGVRKVSYTTDINYNDTKMCWAMTASNMLHWWFTQNENEITQYKQKNNITETESNSNILYYNNKYQRGAVNDEKTKSSFASLLRLGFKNDGNPVRTALTWYLEGRDWGMGDTSIQNSKPRLLFKDVLSSENSIVSMASLNNQNDVNTLFKQAIEHKEAIAVSYEWGGDNYPLGHVVTVWGISIDGDGNVFELWVADSDVGGNSKIPYIYNMGIHYGDDGRPKMVNLSNGKATRNKFSDITTLKLAKNKFNSF